MGFKGGINQYVYTSNNPVNGVDPSGLQEYKLGPIGRLIERIVDKVLSKVLAEPLGVECAGNFCKRNQKPVSWLDDAYAECLELFKKYDYPRGTSIDKDSLVKECANVCMREANKNDSCCKN